MKIKHMLVLGLFFMKNVSIFCQSTPNSDFLKYHGTWQWSNNQDTLVLQITSGTTSTTANGSNVKSIFGCHKYVKNGTIVANYLTSNLPGLIFQDSTTFIAFYQNQNNFNEVKGLIKDKTRNKNVTLILNYLSPSTLKFWVLSKSGIAIGGIPGPIDLPSGIVLTKQ